MAVGAEPAVLPFYFVREEAKSQFPDLPPYFDQLGSFDRQHIVSHLGGMLEPFIEELPIAVERLHDLIQKHRIKDISILHIDTEGFDYQVLQGLQMEVNRPRWILLESKHFTPDIRTAVVQLLSRNLYDVYDLGKDFFACQRDQPDSLRLRGRFRRLLRQPLHNSDETS